MKTFLVTFLMGAAVCLLGYSIRPESEIQKCVPGTLAFIKAHAIQFADSTSGLQTIVSTKTDTNGLWIPEAKEALRKCRLQYKCLEFFLTYFFRSNSLVYNEAPNFEVEEPFYEYRSPTGLQVIESILFSPDPASRKEELMQQATLLHSSASDIYATLYKIDINDKQILESVRLGLIRMITLGISGSDAPDLKSGLAESAQVLKTFRTILQPLLKEENPVSDSTGFYLDKALGRVLDHPDFNSFDRLGFLTEAVFPLQHYLGLLIEQHGLKLNTTGIINYEASNLFSANALFIDPESNPYNLPVFPTDTQVIRKAKDFLINRQVVSLGQKLFFEKLLSGTGSRSCASCHHPEKYFTDGESRAKTLDDKSRVSRNTPTLLYASYQYSQFWDGRATSLKNQIRAVLRNPVEMDANFDTIVQRIKKDKTYRDRFRQAFPDVSDDSLITIDHLTFSIATFLKTLAPFNSSFDRYLQGDAGALNAGEKNGFNLFMGKAQCATCHFAPVFNGLLPPYYDMTQLEVLGTTVDTNFTKPRLDPDSGRFTTTPALYYMRAFKVPVIRDLAKTAPYMHNGAFPDLKSVLEFYNKGGGEGLGLDVPTQTLSAKPLNLTDKEIADIISFLNSMTDHYELKKD